MKVPFDFNSIRSVEFFACYDEPQGERFWQVPVDGDVQEALREMLGATVNQLQLETETIPLFEPGEKYGAIEVAVAPMKHKYMEKIRSMYQTDHFDIHAQALLETDRLAFYFAGFHDGQRRKLLGVKRAAQFKGILSARNRLVAIVDDTLKLVDRDIFRLDQDFDYLVTETDVLILRPSGFEYTAGIAEAIGKHVFGMLHDLETTVACVAFSELEQYVSTHRRAGRLVASLHARSDLAQTSATLLKKGCKANQIDVKTAGRKIAPKPGSEMAFLELLDRRRYTVELIEEEEEYYVAASRRGGKAPPQT